MAYNHTRGRFLSKGRKSDKVRKLAALCGSDGGYYYYCRWSNNSDMLIVYSSSYGAVNNSIYVDEVTASMMNEMRTNLDGASTPTGVEYALWIIDDDCLDLYF